MMSKAIQKGLDTDVPFELVAPGRTTQHQTGAGLWQCNVGRFAVTKDSWQECKVGELAKDERNSFVIGPFGSDLVQADYRESGVPVVFVRDIKKSRFHWISDVYVSDQKAEALKAHSACEGDLVITKMGLPPGIAAVYPESSPAAVITADIIRLRPDSKKVHSSFLCELLNSHDIRKQVYERTAGQTRPKLTLADYKTIRLSLPPLPEQKKIAQILSIWDKAITTTEQLLANSQQQKKALMQQLLTGKQRLLDQDRERFEGEWKHQRLASLCTIKTGKKDVNEGNPEGNYPFFTCASEPTKSDNYSYDCEALLIAGNGMLGKTHYFKGKFEAYQRTYILLEFNGIDVPFLHQYILYWLMRDIEREKQHGAMPYIKLGLLQNFKVLLPCIAEQQKIAAVLSIADQEITSLQQQLDHLKQEKKALMQQLLTGKRRVAVDA